MNPDLDGDGQVSLYEAHLYALRAGESADLPRSTSEAFLERWQPWYADWRGLFGLRGDDSGRQAEVFMCVWRRNSGQSLICRWMTRHRGAR